MAVQWLEQFGGAPFCVLAVEDGGELLALLPLIHAGCEAFFERPT